MKLIPLAATAAALLASPAVHAASVTLVPSSGPNISVQAGGGVLDYRSGLSAITNAGGAWDVRAVVGARSPIAVEAAYIGSVHHPADGRRNQPLRQGGGSLARLDP